MSERQLQPNKYLFVLVIETLKKLAASRFALLVFALCECFGSVPQHFHVHYGYSRVESQAWTTYTAAHLSIAREALRTAHALQELLVLALELRALRLERVPLALEQLRRGERVTDTVCVQRWVQSAAGRARTWKRVWWWSSSEPSSGSDIFARARRVACVLELTLPAAAYTSLPVYVLVVTLVSSLSTGRAPAGGPAAAARGGSAVGAGPLPPLPETGTPGAAGLFSFCCTCTVQYRTGSTRKRTSTVLHMLY